MGSIKMIDEELNIVCRPVTSREIRLQAHKFPYMLCSCYCHIMVKLPVVYIAKITKQLDVHARKSMYVEFF